MVQKTEDPIEISDDDLKSRSESVSLNDDKNHRYNKILNNFPLKLPLTFNDAQR